VLLGGETNPSSIVTFDWTTQEYTRHFPEFNNSRVRASCFLMTGDNGDRLVVVVGGAYSGGMEVWNPLDGTVKTLMSDFPKANYAHGGDQLISVNEGSELIFYYSHESSRGIWKYFAKNNSWSKVGDLIVPRVDCTAVPVHDMSCK
jgi:hypothetical protein